MSDHPAKNSVSIYAIASPHRASYGTTKYCSYYLRGMSCQNPGCMYLHEPGEDADSYSKEDLAVRYVYKILC